MHASVPVRWQVLRLGDLAQVRGGVGFPLERQGRNNGTYPFIKVSDMNLDGNEIYIRSANNYVDDQDIRELGATIFPSGTIVFPKVGAAIATNKKRALVAPTVIDNNMMGVTISDVDRCDGRFLYRWFELVDLSQLANVSAVPSITGSRLKREFVTLPPLSEQRAIAAVLDSIDEAIERTEAFITATEQLRDALLHELLTRGVPGWHSEWQEARGIGTIPASWEVVRLGDVCDEIYRYPTYYNVEYEQEGVLEIRGELIQENAKLSNDLSLYRRITPEFSSIFPKTQLCEGDFVLTVRGTVGKVAYVHKTLEGANITANLLRISPTRSKLPSQWLKHVMMSGQFQSRLQSIVTRTTIDTVTGPEIKALSICLPEIDEQQAIVTVLDGVDEAIERSKTETDMLKSLKASTADALLTGRVRVPARDGS